MTTDGFAKYQAFYERPATIVVEWHDRETPARGWLAIDSLRGGAAGGGTRMRVGGTRQEAVFLAKTMAVKFRVAGPDIGGGKSVIDFNANADAATKRGVLERWYQHVGPYLKACYGTGGDVGVDEVSEATPIIERVVGLAHPQVGIVHGHTWGDGEGAGAKIDRLRHGVEARVVLPDLPGPRHGAWMVADVVTGLGVVRALRRRAELLGEPLEGQRAIIEGFGAVGAFAAYYLAKLGVRTVGASSRNADGTIRVAADARGLDVNRLILDRDGTGLPAGSASRPFIQDHGDGEALFEQKAEIYVPAAASHTTTAGRIARLRAAGVRVVSCGANNPFAYDRKNTELSAWVADMLALQREADRHFAIIPDFVANCGMARTFAYLMAAGGTTRTESILADSEAAIDAATERLLAGSDGKTGLLERGYAAFVPE